MGTLFGCLSGGSLSLQIMPDAQKPFEIFRTGRHTAMNGRTIDFTDETLGAMAAAYDADAHEAPIVVGHPDADAPAYGWVRSVQFADGRLTAEPRQVDPAFARLVADGRFKKVSASFYEPGSAANPKPGGYYLRHVGFLGAQAPAVKGLKTAAFADNGTGVVTFGDYEDRVNARLWRSMRDWLIGKFSQEDADTALPAWDVDFVQEEAAKPDEAPDAAFIETPAGPETQPTTENDMDKAELEARETALRKGEEELAAGQTAFAEREGKMGEAETALALTNAGVFVDRLVGEGRVAPGHRGGLVAFMAALPADGELSFAEGEGDAAKTVTTGARAFLESYLAAQPKLVDFRERTAEDGKPVDAEDSQALATAGLAYQETQRTIGIDMPIEQAVRHVAEEART